MFLSGIDEFLIGKELGKHTINLEPEKSIWFKKPRKHKVNSPLAVFTKHQVNPMTWE